MSTVTSKYQATIPKAVRSALHLNAGDRIVYDIIDDRRAVIRKATPLDIEYLRSVESTLTEWGSPEDEQAYRDL